MFKTNRQVSKLKISTDDKEFNVPLTSDELLLGTRLGMDSHADTSCVNKHAYIETIVDGMTVDAIPFDSQLGKMSNLPIVHAIFAYDDIHTSTTTLLRINNAIYIKDMDNSLLCPNQAREFGTIIDDVPPHLDHTGTGTFSITSDDSEFHLLQHGPTAYLPVRRPTEEELEHCTIVDITEEHDWDPYKGSSSTINAINTAQNDDYLTEEDDIDNHLVYNQIRRIQAMRVSKPKDKLTPEYLAQIWNCGIETARKSIEATTCRYYRQGKNGLQRRFRPSRSMMRYRQLTLPAGEFFSDTMFAKVRSTRGFTCAQIYGNKFGFIKAYPMESNDQRNVGDSLSLMIQDVGVMQKLHVENAKEMVGRKTPFFRRARKEGIDLTTIEPLRPDENYGETLVRIAKLGSSKLMVRKKVPLRFWCYAMEYFCDLSSVTVPGMYRNKGRTGYELVFGSTPDISEYVEFEFYDYCWYWDTPQDYPHEKRQVGRWLGIAHRVGQAMVYYIANNKGTVIARSTVAPLELDEYDVEDTKMRMVDLDTTIKSNMGDYRIAANESKIMQQIDEDDIERQLSYCFELSEDDLRESQHSVYSDKDRPDMDDAPTTDVESEAFDKFLGAYVELPGDDGQSKVLAKVKNRKRDHDGKLLGKYDENPILNTSVYNVESPDGTISEYTANVIAENLWNQVDYDGWDYGQLYEIIGHRKTADAVPIEKGYYETKTGAKRRVITTKGWELQVKWETGETSFIALKDIKESNPIEIADYAKAHKIDKEPAFAWWVPTVVKRRNAILKKTSRKVRKNMKFGIYVPKTYAEAVELDRKNGNTLWQDSVKKEMRNVEVAFKFLDDGTKVPIGFKKITCHLVFDIKFDLTRKARYVGGGHLTSVPACMTYSSVVSRDSVRIMFLIAALNDLDIKMCDIGNAYLNAETRERIWFTAGGEWGDRTGCPVIIVRALYGLKSSGAEWKKTFADYIKHTLGFEPCIGADDNVYLKPEKDSDGNEFYSYIIVYVDDVLVIHKDPDKYMNQIDRDYRLKDKPEAPKMYLGADISKYTIEENGVQVECWSMSADSHVKKALDIINQRFKNDDVMFKQSNKTSEHPFSSQSYRPELDTSRECDEEEIQFYQSLIGIMRWLCEIGRVDILTETSLLSTYLTTPRIGHLHQALHVFKYLKDHKRSRIVFDPSYVDINDDHLPEEERAGFKAKYMKELYPDAVEDLPPNAPKPRGKPVQITCFVDADHAGDRVTRRSRTGVLIFVNKAPIMFYSKRQNTVETSTFGSEFVAMKHSVEMIKALKYKLLMFGIEVMDIKIFGDNNSVIINSSVPESTLKKKHHSVNYNYVREAVASGLALIFKVDTGSNLADLFTKLLNKETRKELVQRILY